MIMIFEENKIRNKPWTFSHYAFEMSRYKTHFALNGTGNQTHK